MTQNRTDAAKFEERLYDLLNGAAMDLAHQWLERLKERLAQSSARIFPEQTLLNHIPMLLRRIAYAVAFDEKVVEQDFVREELAQIAKLRRSQGYGPEEVASEFDLLADLVFDYIEQDCERLLRGADPRTVFQVAHRLRRALDRMSAIALAAYRHETASDRLERSQILDDFGRAVTHELRNRLNSVLLAIEVYRSTEPDDPRRPQLLDKLEAAVKRADGVVEDVFSVAMTGGRIDPMNEARATLDKIVADLVAEMRIFADQANVELLVETEGAAVYIDPVHARLALMNLLSNAIKYADPTKARRWVRISASHHDERAWQVDVSDNGVGISESARERIFERYVRGDEDDTSSRPGQGIGLYIARRAVQALGGDLWVHSARGQGSTFSFTVLAPEHSLPAPDSNA